MGSVVHCDPVSMSLFRRDYEELGRWDFNFFRFWVGGWVRY